VAKKYKLNAEELQPLVAAGQTCIATDRITVEGLPVRFMYREAPIGRSDSGWRFLSGLETDAYMEKAGNQGQHELNFLANCDRSIVEFLEAPIGSAFQKAEAADAPFEAVTDWEPDED
jgi:hypothetical protein